MAAATAAGAPSTGLTWGIMSTAFIATKVAKAIQAARGATLLAVASRNLEKAEAWAKAHEVPKAFGSYEELLACAEIQAVYIPLPTGVRKEWVIKAAKAGKHVLCEKPAAINSADLREMIAACEAAGVQFMDGVMFMHHDRLAAMSKVLHEEKLVGDITSVVSGFSFAMPAEALTSNIRGNADTEPMGALGDLGWYTIRHALWAYNYEMPTAVTAAMHLAVNGVPIHVVATLAFAGGRSASFDVSFNAGFRQWAEVCGTLGSVDIDDFCLGSPTAAKFQITTERGMDAGFEHMSKKVEERVVEHSVQHVRMIENFAVAAVKKDAFWPEVALKTQIVTDAVLEAARSGKTVEVPAL